MRKKNEENGRRKKKNEENGRRKKGYGKPKWIERYLRQLVFE
jgi:hypothetical protein